MCNSCCVKIRISPLESTYASRTALFSVILLYIYYLNVMRADILFICYEFPFLKNIFSFSFGLKRLLSPSRYYSYFIHPSIVRSTNSLMAILTSFLFINHFFYTSQPRIIISSRYATHTAFHTNWVACTLYSFLTFYAQVPRWSNIFLIAFFLSKSLRTEGDSRGDRWYKDLKHRIKYLGRDGNYDG